MAKPPRSAAAPSTDVERMMMSTLVATERRGRRADLRACSAARSIAQPLLPPCGRSRLGDRGSAAPAGCGTGTRRCRSRTRSSPSGGVLRRHVLVLAAPRQQPETSEGSRNRSGRRRRSSRAADAGVLPVRWRRSVFRGEGDHPGGALGDRGVEARHRPHPSSARRGRPGSTSSVDPDGVEQEAQGRADRDAVVALLSIAGPATVMTRSWIPRPWGSSRPISAAVATLTQRAWTSRGRPPDGTSRAEQRGDQHLLGALGVLDRQHSTLAGTGRRGQVLRAADSRRRRPCWPRHRRSRAPRR